MIADKENATVGTPVAKKLRTEGTPAKQATTAAAVPAAPDAATTNVVSLPTLKALDTLLAEGKRAAQHPNQTTVDAFIVVLHDSAAKHLEMVLDGVSQNPEATRVPIFTADVSGGEGWSKEAALAKLTTSAEAGMEVPAALPILFLFITYRADSPSADGPAVPRLVAAKPIASNLHIHSQSLLQPILAVAHLEERLAAYLGGSSTITAPSYTLLYFGASWCPPCMNILKALPTLLADGQRPGSIQLCAKADMDLAQPVFDLFAVETIPTFVILDNEQLLEGGRYCLTEQVVEEPPADADATKQGSTGEKKLVSRVKAAAVVGRIQNSQEATIEAFLQKHCGTLSFTLGEDF